MAKLRKDNSGTLDIEFRRAELMRAESVLERISNRAVALQTEQRAPDRVILRQRARTPLHPISSYPLKEILIAMVVGFAIPIGLAVLIEAARPKVNSGESLQRNVHLNVLGEVARLPARSARAKSKSLRYHRQPLLFEESVDALCTNLFLSQWGQAKTFAITSAVNAEGKTSIATQLALSVSRMRNVKTLLIDCDLRIPELHNYFDIPLGPGLTDILTGALFPEETIVETWLENLDVLPAGQLNSNPHSLFTAEAMQRMLGWAMNKYKYIILDTPPVLEASESLVAAKASDVSILCTMQNVSRFDQIRKACERLTVVGSPPIGAILNGVTYRHGKYSYHYHDGTTRQHTPDISV
jgi:capsular exopolysaccharide synthesis family protein